MAMVLWKGDSLEIPSWLLCQATGQDAAQRPVSIQGQGEEWHGGRAKIGKWQPAGQSPIATNEIMLDTDTHTHLCTVDDGFLQ